MADLQEFISDITADKKRYCLVCFRTENERKLVAPVALAEFVKLSRLEKISKKESACIYCERQAEVALKLYKTLSYARQVNQVLWSLVNKKMSPRGIAYLLPSKVRGQTAGPGSVKRNKLLSLLRRYQSFSQTDVLVVDATTPNIPAEKNSDSILIEDDDETPTTVPRLVPIEQLLEKPPQPDLNTAGSIVLYPVKTTSTAENQFLILPDGANVNLDGNMVKLVNNGPIPMLLPNGRIVAVQPQNSKQILVHPQNTNQILVPMTNSIQSQPGTVKNDLACIKQLKTVEEIITPDHRKIGEKVALPITTGQFTNNNLTKSNAIQYVGSGLPNSVNIQYVPSNNVQITKNGNNIQYVPSNNAQIPKNPQVLLPAQNTSEQTGSNQMCKITNLNSEPICKISDFRSVSASDGSDMCQISHLRSLLEEVATEQPPEPKKKADPNIDWEDKIPMDVISFMDAKDPNAANILAPPPAPPPSSLSAPPSRPDITAKPSRQKAIILNDKLDLLMPKGRYRRSTRKRGCQDDDPIVIN